MDSSIILIDKCPFEEDEEIYPEDISFNSNINNVDRIGKREQNKRIKEFLEILPHGMFALENKNELIYQGGMRDWKTMWLFTLKNAVALLDPTNCLDSARHFRVKDILDNPLSTDIRFVIPYYGSYCQVFKSLELMKLINELKIGDRIYIGNVLNYSF